jgi:hypothetical protein
MAGKPVQIQATRVIALRWAGSAMSRRAYWAKTAASAQAP